MVGPVLKGVNIADPLLVLMCTLVKKRNSSLEELHPIWVPRGVQGGHGVRWNTQPIWATLAKKVPLHFFKIQLEQARSFFFEWLYLLKMSLNEGANGNYVNGALEVARVLGAQ